MTSPGVTVHGHQTRGSKPHISQRARDIFPIPVPSSDCGAAVRLSRRSSQRLARKRHAAQRVHDAIQSLNWLAGFGLEENSGIQPPDQIQQDVIGRAVFLSNLCNDKGDLAQVPNPEAALKELLQGRSEYGSELPTTLAACSLDRISLPQSLKGAPATEDLLDVNDRRYLQCPEQMLRPEAEVQCLDEFHPYWDPLLRNHPRTYKRFIQKLHAADYLVYTQKPKSFCGVFFAHKADGKKIRMIIDARGSNRLFREPPGVQLLTSDGFSRIELVAPEDLMPGSEEYEKFISGRKVHMGLSDVKDCFHRLRQPKWLSEYFCFDGIPAKWVGMHGCVLDGVMLEPDSIIFPAPGSLSMGFTWSLFFAQKINERMMTKVLRLEGSVLVNDRSEAIVFDETSQDRKIHHYVYVDNLGILSTDHITVEEGLKEVQEVFNKEMLILHPGVVHSRSVKALGCDLRGDLFATRVTAERYHKLHQAIQAILDRKKVSGRILEVVIGHATFVGLTCRNLLSIFNTVYKYIRSNYSSPSILWRSVREELFVFRSLMIYLHADWARPWNTYVSASDASLSGFGIVSSTWSREDVAEVGRLHERGRFKRAGPHSARESALTTAGFVRDEATNEWVAGWLDDADYLQLSGWALNREFREVPSRLLQKDLWTPRLWGRWQHEAGILELEARALVKSLKRIAVSVFGHDIRQLLLTDNMSVCLSFDRSRSRSYSLLQQIRRFSAYCLSRNIACTVRWIPSELNSADEPSRFDSSEESKSLAHVIPRILQSQKGGHPSATVGKKAQHRTEEKSPAESSQSHEFTGSQKSCQTPSPKEAFGGSGLADSQAAGRLHLDGSEPGSPGPDKSKEKKPRVKLRFNQFHREQQEKKNQASAAESQETSQDHCGPPDAERHDPAGKPCSGARHQPSIPAGVGRVPEFCPPEELRFHECCRRGLHVGAAYEQHVPCWASELSSRQAPGCVSAPTSQLRSKRVIEIAPLLEGDQRVQKAHTWPKPEGAATSSLGSLCVRAEANAAAPHGCFSPFGGFNICQTIRAPSCPCVFPGPASPGSDAGLVTSLESRGERASLQDGRIRYLSAHRQSLAGRVDRSHLRSAQEESSRVASLGFRLPRIQPRIHKGHQVVCGRSNTLPNPPLRPVNRPCPGVPFSARGATSRHVAFPKEHHEVREGGATSRDLGILASSFQTTCSRVRGRPWGDLVGKKVRTNLQRRRCVGNQYMMDLFSGTGAVSQACAFLGFRAKEWDVRYGEHHDLTRACVVKKLLQEIHRGRVLACMMSPAPRSFSVGLDRIKPLRTPQFPWGLPQRFLSASEKAEVIADNKCICTCVNVMRALDTYCIPYILGLPATSKAWHLPPLHDHSHKPHVLLVDADSCQFGSPWKAKNRFLVAHVDPQDLTRLSQVCDGSGRQCSRLLRPHQRGPRRTVAQIYPKHLCLALAHALTAHRHTIYAAHFL